MEPDTITLPGRVEKLIRQQTVEHAQISLVGADHLYDELRIPNVHKWNPGTPIEVTIRPKFRD